LCLMRLSSGMGVGIACPRLSSFKPADRARGEAVLATYLVRRLSGMLCADFGRNSTFAAPETSSRIAADACRPRRKLACASGSLPSNGRTCTTKRNEAEQDGISSRTKSRIWWVT
jgi:hypothetical protein